MNAEPNQPSPLPDQFIYFFAAGETDGNAGMKTTLGGKGANLAEMTSLGIPVPPGFTISTEICQAYFDHRKALPADVKTQTLKALARVGALVGRAFGDAANPLLVSVRSGARASMPGMMDTILNLGLNDQTVEGLATQSGDPRFAWDSYRRFVTMYANVVMGMNVSLLEVALEDVKDARGYREDSELNAADLRALVTRYKRQIIETTGRAFPNDPHDQLWGAIGAVFDSWHSPRANTYRQLHGYPVSWGTAVNVQSMVFGNMGDTCATGVAFTRNPSTGERAFYGEYLINAQGEDVVAGLRTPRPIAELAREMPAAYADLVAVYEKLEMHYRDMQDIEFTIERGKLWMLQTRAGKRTARASLRIACEMIDETLISIDEALMRISPPSLDQLLHPTLDPDAKRTLLAKGLPASPGGVTGRIAFSNEDAVRRAEAGEPVILVRIETSPEDIDGMIKARGVLTARGGMTSHAAVVARGMGKPCVAGCGEIEVDYARGEVRVKGFVLTANDQITIDGATGEVFLGEVKTIEPTLDAYFARVMTLADGRRRLGVRANADAPKDAAVARAFGAEGIGLCRTEHMFFGADRIDVVRQMILSETRAERAHALERLRPMQRADFAGLFREMRGLPVTIRLLDPPLHEFLPHDEVALGELATRLNVRVETLRPKVRALHEMNPMLGHRGCRLAVTFPEIYLMQARAIAEAAFDVMGEGIKIAPEIMVPLIATAGELKRLRAEIAAEVRRVHAERGRAFEFTIGTMIELPRAALTADEIAADADFFSFGTNDLTQTTLGISRDDAGRFLGTYVGEGLFEADPFATIDQKGVGQLVEMAIERGRRTKADLKMGVCGEHGGDPASIRYFHRIGLDYVSCSPYRVPIARLAAAQAAIEDSSN